MIGRLHVRTASSNSATRRVAVLLVALLAVAAAIALVAGTPFSTKTERRWAARLPSPVIVAQGVSSANSEHVFFDPARDFAMMRRVFNAVSLMPGDPELVAVAREAGLAIVLEFDYKNEFFAGEDISQKVARVVAQIRAHPGTVSAIHDATLDRFHASGHLDGLSISNNLKNFDAEAQRTAWKRARERWAEPFILWSTSSQLSFGADTHDGTPDAVLATDAYMQAPMDEGAHGLAIWAWHQLYDGEVYTFLNKDGSTNPVWERMAAVAQRL